MNTSSKMQEILLKVLLHVSNFGLIFVLFFLNEYGLFLSIKCNENAKVSNTKTIIT